MKNYEREFSEISDTLVTAYQNWEIWWLYKSERPKYVKVINNYLNFFSNSIHAHWVALVMSVWCLIDENNLSLLSLYKKMCNSNSIKDEIRRDIENRINGISYIIKGITIIRHNVVAHISNQIDSDVAFAKAKLNYDDIRNIIVELGNVFNLMRVANGKDPVGFWLKMRSDKPYEFSEDDTERLLNDLIKYNSFSA